MQVLKVAGAVVQLLHALLAGRATTKTSRENNSRGMPDRQTEPVAADAFGPKHIAKCSLISPAPLFGKSRLARTSTMDHRDST